VGLLGVALLALLLRALGFEWVFVGGDTVVFPPADAQYHVRRAFHAWVEFPRVLMRDPYLNHPAGATVPWPPLFDFTVAAFAKLLARDATAFQRVAAWTPPLIGALVVIPVYSLGRELYSRGVGLGAAALVATLPMSVSYSQVGQVDHHCAVQLIGSFLLLFCARLAGGIGSPIALGFGLAVGRVAMLLTWPGSLLYLVLIDATLCIAAIVGGRRSVSGAQSASALGALACVAPLVWASPLALGGAYSAIALSRVHALALLAAALVAGCLWMLGRPPGRRVASRGLRTAWTAGPGVALLAVLLLLPEPREGIVLGLRFLTMQDAVGSETLEQLPLFRFLGGATGSPAWHSWGGFAYALPLAPVAVLLAARRDRRGAAWVVAGWSAFFAFLAIAQQRYGNDLAPAAAIAFALALAAMARRATAFLRADARRWLSPLLACGMGLALLAPAVWVDYLPAARSSLRALAGDYAHLDRSAVTVAGTLTRFMEEVRQVTPETSGYFDSGQAPEYGIVADPNLGHALKNVARRATPSDPFAAPIGKVNWLRSLALLRSPTEHRGLELAEQLRARYVVTMSSSAPGRLQGWLHSRDGLAQPGWSRTEHFRLITEGPFRGVPYAAGVQALGFRVRDPVDAGGAGAAPYKLFEIVEGAVLEVRDEPDVEVIAAIVLRTPTGRTIRFDARSRTDERGIARLRVPYPTGRSIGRNVTAARGPYRISSSAGSSAVHVSEQQVREGAVIAVPKAESPPAAGRHRRRSPPLR
jgi:asparagine N-glycosylation enzyme membrane subunit Stt3